MKTTLNKIREHSPCTSGWEKLLTYLGKTKADDEPLSLLTILDSNGIEDALWCLRAVEGRDREIRLYAVWCVRQVQHLLTDKRSLDALDVAERYANGDATDAELTAAAEAARAAWAAAWSTRDAASAARAAARVAAWSARDAVWAARAAARDAARDAASAAAWAAARDAARGDADAAAYTVAAWVVADAVGDARGEMVQRQEAELRRICEEG